MSSHHSSTLSLKDRKPYTNASVSKRKQDGQRGPKRNFDRPAANKATYSHEAHLNELHGRKIEVWGPGSENPFCGTLVGYDAFSITLEDTRGEKWTVFKGSIFAFKAGKETN